MIKKKNVKKAKIETVKDEITPEEMIENVNHWKKEREIVKLRELQLFERKMRLRSDLKALRNMKTEVEERNPFDPPVIKNPLFKGLNSLGAFTFSFDLDDPQEAARQFADDIVFHFSTPGKAEEWFTNFVYFMRYDVKFGKFDKI